MSRRNPINSLVLVGALAIVGLLAFKYLSKKPKYKVGDRLIIASNPSEVFTIGAITDKYYVLSSNQQTPFSLLISDVDGNPQWKLA